MIWGTWDGKLSTVTTFSRWRFFLYFQNSIICQLDVVIEKVFSVGSYSPMSAYPV